ncbi:guanine nucleotide binding protein, alpha subunit [Mycena vulgaris]|nr:guanine nucleotide binding protein, alpha subunit [Mycena vulgaris]
MRPFQRRPKTDAATTRSEEIAKELGKRWAFIRDRKSVLVLGPRNAGKSTFMRQARLFNSEFTLQERLEFSVAIHAGLLDTMRRISCAFDEPAIKAAISSFFQATAKDRILTEHISATVRNIWANPILKDAVRGSPQFQVVSGSLEYFLDSLPRLASPGYTPTDLDIMLPRWKSMLVGSWDHPMATTLVRVRHDAGLQRKWIHHFSDAEALIFVVDLACYDQIPLNAMREAMRQFEDVYNSGILYTRTVVLLMNKLDLFREKLARVPFSVCFPEYPDADEPIAAVMYCIERFSPLCSTSRRREMRAWCTNSLDTEQVRVPLQQIGEFICQNRLHPLHTGM